MMNFGKLVLSFVALPAFLLASSSASAAPIAACGGVDFTTISLNNCAIQVEAECEANCTSLNLQVGCTGGCAGEPIPGCTDPCGTTCLAECNPDKLDCVAGCHTECEEPFIDKCKVDHPERDCVTDAKASCTSYCRDACAVMPSGCEDHCLTCCSGSCTSYSNMKCNIDCFANLEGSCKVQCKTPEGAIMCKDPDGRAQLIPATQVPACIEAMISEGLKVDVSARGKCVCTLSGCDCAGDASAGGLACSASPGQDSPFAPIAVAVGMAAAGISAARRRNRKNG